MCLIPVALHPYVTAGCLTTSSTLPRGRLSILVDHLHELIKRHQIDQAVIEQVYFARNKSTALVTAQVHGVLLYVLDLNRIPTEYVTPLQVKRQITGQGFASKQQIQQAVTERLQLPTLPTPDDAADALAIALTFQTQVIPQS